MIMRPGPTRRTDEPVTILIPHYETPDTIRICLRAIRKYTGHAYAVRVLDNGSSDASTKYLRTLPWIDFVPTGLSNDVWRSHFDALNLGVRDVDTPFFVVMHSDTFVHHPGWLGYLLGQLRNGSYAAVGSRNQIVSPASVPFVRSLLTSVRKRSLDPGVPSLRSLCVAYRTGVFRKSGCRFSATSTEDVTHSVSRRLVAQGHRIKAIPAWRLSKYLMHTSATTRIEIGAYDKDPAKHKREYRSFLRHPRIKSLIDDDSLDQ